MSGTHADPAVDAARRYFDAVAAHDLDAALACWKPGGIDHLAPVGELRVPEDLRAYFDGVFASFPDFRYEVMEMFADGERVAVWWRAAGTFTGRPYTGIRANGTHVQIEGIDLARVENGLLVRLDSYWDDTAVARQIGILPARGSAQERALTALFNLRTRLGGRLKATRLARRGAR